MPNITISLNEQLLKSGREYASNRNLSLNALIRNLLERTVQRASQDWLEDCFHKMDQADGNSSGEKWQREDLYEL